MKRSIKDFYLSTLNENDNSFLHITSDVVDDIKNVNFSKGDDYIRIDFTTTYGKDLSIVTKFSEFKKWLSKNSLEHKHAFVSFVKDYVSKSKEVEDLNEIIDDSGNIMPDDDKPSNATNSHIGSSKFDLEKIYKQSIPKSIRFYSGDLGIGIISW